MGYYEKTSSPPSGLTSFCECFVHRRTRAPTFCGWVVLLALGFVIANVYYNKGSIGSLGNPNMNERPDRARFQGSAMLPRVPEPGMHPRLRQPPELDDIDSPRDPQEEEFQAVEAQNHAGVQAPRLPSFDPNVHDNSAHKKAEAKATRQFGHPRPKEWPVDYILTPTLECPQGLPLLVVVHSKPEGTGARSAIRTTWGIQEERRFPHMESLKWKVVFVMGTNNNKYDQTVAEEAGVYGDILQGDFADSPFEGTRKTRLTIEWLEHHNKQNCPPRFVIKTDDNVFFNMHAIIPWLEARYLHQNGVYIGVLQRNEKPNRDATDPHYVSERDYNRRTFPDMILGPVYMLSADVVTRLSKVMTYAVPIAVEDAFIAILAEKASVTPRHNDHFQMLTKPSNICHHLQLFFIFDLKPFQHIEYFRNMVNARTHPECQELEVMDRAKGLKKTRHHGHGPWPDL